MRLLRIFSLLFSLGQFLLILKLIELVRGNPTNLSRIAEPHPPNGKSFFLAPSKIKQKNYRLWSTSTEETPTTSPPVHIQRFGIDEEEEYQFESTNSSMISNKASSTSSNSSSAEPSEGRLCPGCEGGTCGGALSNYGFPVIPVVVAIIVGIIWFFVFLFLWYFAKKPIKSTGGYAEAASGGYGSGGYADNSGWSSMMDDSSGGGSILDLFKGHGRAFNNFNDLTAKITETLSNLAILYNSF